MSLSSPVSSQQITKVLEVVGEIFQEENIKICVKESVKGGLITGVSTLIGGLLGGKTGLLAGGLLGTLVACNMTSNYKSLIQVISEMDYDKQKRMVDTLQNVVTSIDITDVIKFGILLTTNQSIKQVVIFEAINFIRNELSMEIVRS